MALLKHLVQIGGATLAILLCLSPTTARALTLKIVDQEIVNISGEGVESFSHVVSGVDFSGQVRARTGLFTTEGVGINGALLELADLEIINPGPTPVTFNDPATSMLRFDHNFGNLFTGTVSGFVFFIGNFMDLSHAGLDPANTATAVASFESEPPQPPNPTEVVEQIINIQPFPGESIVFFDAIDFFSVNANEVNDRLTVGELSNFTLGANEKLALGSPGFCIVMSDSPDFTQADAISNCRSVPEPSSIGAVLAALGLGLSWMLRRKQTSIDSK